jgi:hypothetical protein
MSILGKLIYKLYFKPKSTRATITKFGGKDNYQLMLTSEAEMKEYAFNKLTIPGNFCKNGKYTINFLTGDKFIHQTLFCTYSFFKFLNVSESCNFQINYFSDGTLSLATKSTLNRRFPYINVIDFQATSELVEKYLPVSKFPYLRKKIDTAPLFKKLVFTHIARTGLTTFFDSDMLFLRRPEEFLAWLYSQSNDDTHAFCIQDVMRSYGYSDNQINTVWPVPIKFNINSGMYSIFSEKIDFEFIEALIKKFELNYGSQYYLEQLITAILLEGSPNLFVAPQSTYIVLPTKEQIISQIGTLHHYVNESKEFYFKESWKKQLI